MFDHFLFDQFGFCSCKRKSEIDTLRNIGLFFFVKYRFIPGISPGKLEVVRVQKKQAANGRKDENLFSKN